ncbi:hypothetical protein [uncultured Thiothrix sp.]|uniref:hypothetical protein n=1 Tax=uncultured Thiothrix sp. TaxID=223185 RepID=UPI002628C9A7|nr:hypothetical protein [uncultured Thiothrix sp.]HMT93136.1 hypothetical protein [Thiolinea sp.]
MKKKLLLLLGLTVIGTTTMLVTTTAHAHYVPPKPNACGCMIMTYSEPAFIW